MKANISAVGVDGLEFVCVLAKNGSSLHQSGNPG